MPNLSIITINYNNLAGLQKTIQSVFEQSFEDFEYIIIDGGSIDGSKEYIEKYGDKLTYWVSEKDAGVYNGMNKGIKKATGIYSLFLNSGDYFNDNTVVESLIKNSEGKDIVYGDIIYKDEYNEHTVVSPDVLSLQYLFNNTIPHPCTLIHKRLFDLIGPYNESINICADWAFFLDSIIKDNATYKHINKIITTYSLGGISSQPNSQALVEAERLNYLRSNYPLVLDEYNKLLLLEQKFNLLQKSRAINFLQKIFPGLKHALTN